MCAGCEPLHRNNRARLQSVCAVCRRRPARPLARPLAVVIPPRLESSTLITTQHPFLGKVLSRPTTGVFALSDTVCFEDTTLCGKQSVKTSETQWSTVRYGQHQAAPGAPWNCHRHWGSLPRDLSCCTSFTLCIHLVCKGMFLCMDHNDYH